MALAGGPGVETAVAQGPVTDVGQDPDPGRDPSDPDRGREGEGLAVGTDEEAGAGPDGPSLAITKARRVREIAGRLTGKTRGPVSREIMIRKKLDTRIRRTRAKRVNMQRTRILKMIPTKSIRITTCDLSRRTEQLQVHFKWAAQ